MRHGLINEIQVSRRPKVKQRQRKGLREIETGRNEAPRTDGVAKVDQRKGQLERSCDATLNDFFITLGIRKSD